MKNLRMYLLAVLAGVALSASAQFVNVGSSGSSRLTSVTTDGWNRLYVSYLPSKLKTDGEDALKMKGFSVGYMRGISVTNKIPLYIEVGAAFQNRAEKEDAEYGGYALKAKINAMSLNVPVHLLYRFNVTDDFSIEPFFGFDFRFNLAGKYKLDASGGGLSVSEDYSLFDDDDMYELGLDACKRFQAGWHVGVNLSYKPVYFGVNYGKDFNEINDYVKVATTSVFLGFNF